MKRYLVFAAIISAAFSGSAIASDKPPVVTGPAQDIQQATDDDGQGPFNTVGWRGRARGRAYGYRYNAYRPYYGGYGYGRYYRRRPYYGYGRGWYGGWRGYPGIGVGVGPIGVGGGFY